MQIRTLIVDDEPHARKRLRNLLKSQRDFVVSGECRNGLEATNLIRSKKPDLIFMDIQMPGQDGFEVIEGLELSYSPFIIFVTAFEKYALKAFDVKAIDYLLKPFDDERFFESLERAKSHIKQRKSSELNDRLIGLLNDYQEDEREWLVTLTIKEGGRTRTIKLEDVLFLQTEGNYVSLELKDESYLYRATMTSIQGKLNPDNFLRIHRTYVVNLLQVSDVAFCSSTGEYSFRLKDGRQINSGRTYRDSVAATLNKTHLV